MFKSLIFFARFFIFWLFFFALDKFIFFFVFHKNLREIPLGEKLATFYHALRLDLSMAAYLAVLPILSFLFWYFKSKNPVNLRWITVYNRVLIVLFSFLSIVNFNVYREWGAKLNYKVFALAFESPAEAMASSSSSPVLLSFLIMAIMVYISFYMESRLIKKQITFVKTALPLKAIVALLVIGFNFLLIRGGLGVAPNSQSMAYFSKYEILNHASLNTEWNLISSMLASKKTNKNPYIYGDPQQAEQTLRKLYEVEKDTSINILSTQRPNIVIFLLESFTADLTKSLGNEPDITPVFDSLVNDGVLFTNIYAAGNRTDKGILGTLTGFPTLGTGSIVKWPEKMQKIPAISQSLANENYNTSFYYGGESEFDNYKAFILGHSYQKLIDKNNFDQMDMNSKWGAYDGLVFSKQLSDINNVKQPFFSTILSLTNHEPFEVPGKAKFGKANNIAKFKSTAFYTDSCIGAYMTEAKKQEWYKKTLFIFIADHGHKLPKDKFEIYQPQRYHIPMLFYGDVLKKDYKGKKINKLGSQQDLAATLLAQLNLPHQNFLYSKNLFNPYTKNFAFYTWDNGLGYLSDQHQVSYDHIGKMILHNSDPSDTIETEKHVNLGKAYLQAIYQQFINL
jgi:phosphoglycerol transferase MdoB-like AlkP superfamily enzyme